ncbi:MAG: DUF3179 domain-containing protein [Gemmatimonadota bacterium]
MFSSRATRTPAFVAGLVWAASALLWAGCSGGGSTGGSTSDPRNRPPNSANLNCSLPPDRIMDGGTARDGIPSLLDPVMVAKDDPEADYMLDTDRVIGFHLDGQWMAIPHNILWWHEIVNLTTGTGARIAATYCPLTGSSMLFDLRSPGVSRFIVSGLLFNNNLMMLDKDSESLWPQMFAQARCGAKDGVFLPMLPSIEMRWGAWKQLHPETLIVSGNTGFSRDYTLYPYGLYEDLDAPPLFDMPLNDRRRRTKERLLGIPFNDGGMAFPYLELQEQGPTGVAQAVVGGQTLVVFWDEQAYGAMAYLRSANGLVLDFKAQNGTIVDVQTGSTWRIDGLAIAGPMAGTQLRAIDNAFVSFWFSWSAFHPQTEIWTNGS